MRILENIYSETFSAVRVGGHLTEWYQTVVGVLQGDVLSPLLFLIFLEITIAVSVEDIDVGAWINGTQMTDLRFTDDIAVLAENVTDLQEAVDRISMSLRD